MSTQTGTNLRDRYYAQSQGRFLSEDSLPGIAQLPSSFHRYVYADNRPVDMFDPTGTNEITLESQGVVGWLVGNLAAISFAGLAGFEVAQAGAAVVTIAVAAVGLYKTWDVLEDIGRESRLPQNVYARAVTLTDAQIAADIDVFVAAAVAVQGTPQGHHSVPKYFGGHPAQALDVMPLGLHELIHIVLDNFRAPLSERRYAYGPPRFAGIARYWGRENAPVLMALATDAGWRAYMGEVLYEFYTMFGYFGRESLRRIFQKEHERYIDPVNVFINPACYKMKGLTFYRGGDPFPKAP